MPLARLITLTSTMIVLHITKKMNPIICRTIASCAQHILHLHAFPTCQETARLHEDAIPTILSGNKETHVLGELVNHPPTDTSKTRGTFWV